MSAYLHKPYRVTVTRANGQGFTVDYKREGGAVKAYHAAIKVNPGSRIELLDRMSGDREWCLTPTEEAAAKLAATPQPAQGEREIWFG